ncbi:MAG: Lsr2 family DNA-binding protein, partial [Dermatophilaceae bacterium]
MTELDGTYNADDVRAWAKDNGLEVGERGRMKREVFDAYEEHLRAGEAIEVEDQAHAEAPHPAERKPRRTTLRDNLRSARRSPTVVSGGRKRVAMDGALGGMWSAMAMAMQMSDRTGVNTPTARVMMFQGPGAGVMLDQALAGTLPDRMLLQPLARGGKRSMALGMVAGPPLITAIITRRPALYEPLAPVLRALLAQYLLEVGPQIKAARKKEEEAMRTLGELLGGDDAL